jgi:integrase
MNKNTAPKIIPGIERRVKNGGGYNYRARVRRKGYEKSATFSSITRAKDWLSRKQAEIELEVLENCPSNCRHTVDDLIRRYIDTVLPTKPRNARNTKRILNWWGQEIGKCLLTHIKPSVIAQKRDKLLSEVNKAGKMRSNSTVVRYLSSLSHAFTLAVKEWEWMRENPILKITKPKESQGRTRFLDEQEKDLLLKTCYEIDSDTLYPIVVLALSTGMRKGEILNLRKSNIDLSNNQILIETSKNGESRLIPLIGYAKKLLQEKVRGHDFNAYLFASKNHLAKKANIRKRWESAVKKANLNNFRFHDIRHTAASYLAMSGANAIEIALFLGHKTLHSTKRYTHFSRMHLQKMAENHDAKLFNNTQGGIHGFNTK